MYQNSNCQKAMPNEMLNFTYEALWFPINRPLTSYLLLTTLLKLYHMENSRVMTNQDL